MNTLSLEFIISRYLQAMVPRRLHYWLHCLAYNEHLLPSADTRRLLAEISREPRDTLFSRGYARHALLYCLGYDTPARMLHFYLATLIAGIRQRRGLIADGFGLSRR